MNRMHVLALVLGFPFFLASQTGSAADPLPLKIVAGPVVPKGSVIFLAAGEPGPGQKSAKVLHTFADLNAKHELKSKGPFDVYFQPKQGKPVLMLTKWNPTAELKLSDHLGTVLVRGDDLPRAEQVVLTAPGDPGPGEKGHVSVQVAGDYKESMAVPPGFYMIWVKPANGTRAQRIADKIRVLAGRETQFPEE